MHSPTDRSVQYPVAPDEIDVLQRVFDAVLIERGMTKESAEALDLARLILRLYFDAVNKEAALHDAVHSEDINPARVLPER